MKKPRSLGTRALSNIVRLTFIAVISLIIDLNSPTGRVHANAEGAQETSLDLVVSDTDLEIDENDSGSFTVRLNRQPDTTVSVRISKTNDDITLSSTSLSFNSSNWNVEQEVTLTAGQDDDEVNDTDTITISSGTISKTVNVDIDDDDDPGFVVTPSVLTVVESSTAEFTVKLATQPSVYVIMLIISPESISTTPSHIGFNSSNWNKSQTIKVFAKPDMNNVSENLNLSLKTYGEEYRGLTHNMSISITDDNTPTLMISSDSLDIDEGSGGSITVHLSHQPVEFFPASLRNNNDDISLDKHLLTFDNSNWNMIQKITVTAAEDNDTVNEDDIITISVKGVKNKTVTVNINDNDPLSLIVNPGSLDINEGDTDSIAVRLSHQPVGSVSVSFSKNNPDISLSGEPLTFNVENWDAAQNITVTAGQDDDAADDADTITIEATGVADKTIAVNIDDDEIIAFVVSPDSLNIDEGDSSSFNVSLSHQPGGDIPVMLSSKNDDISVKLVRRMSTRDHQSGLWLASVDNRTRRLPFLSLRQTAILDCRHRD